MRSLATITRSPASLRYSSRTLPVCRCTRPGTWVGSGFSTNPDTVPPRGSVLWLDSPVCGDGFRPRAGGGEAGPSAGRADPSSSGALADPVEEVGGGPLGAGVDVAGAAQGRRPGGGGGEGLGPRAGGGEAGPSAGRADPSSSVALADPVEEVGGGPLDAGVDVAGAVQGRRPGGGAGGEHPGTRRRPVQRGVLVPPRP